jgi:GntR family transcriptional regulator
MPLLAEQIGPLDALGGGPLYRRLEDALREALRTQRLKPNEALPPERDLASELSVSRITLRKALDSLVEEGLLVRKQGAGTFVANRVEKQFAKLSSFSEDMAARGRTVRSEWLGRSVGAVTPDDALTLGFGLDGVDVVGASLYAALEAAGNRPVRALQRLRAVLFNAEQAKLLGIEAGAPGLYIERRGFLDDGRVIEATQSWYRGDAYDFVAELDMRA